MTSAHRMAVVYGNSILLTGIAEGLRSLHGLEVIERKPMAGQPSCAELHPNIVVLDAAQVAFHQLKELIDTFPSASSPLFVLLNADGQRMTVYSAQCLPAVTFADLAQVIEKIFDIQLKIGE